MSRPEMTAPGVVTTSEPDDINVAPDETPVLVASAHIVERFEVVIWPLLMGDRQFCRTNSPNEIVKNRQERHRAL